MIFRRSSRLKWLLPLILLGLAGCVPAGVDRTASALGGGTALVEASDTLLPDNTPAPETESAITLTPPQGFRALAVAAGRGHTCAITDRNTIQCWGENEDGQLGDGTNVSTARAGEVIGIAGDAAEVAAGYNHTCALTAEGEVYCWGNNGFGQLGDGTQTSRNKAVKVPLPGRMVAVSAGTLHSCAADGREIYCWGIVEYEYLDGEDVARLSIEPRRVDAGEISSGSRIVSIGSGFAHDCALTEAGDVYCWGRNDIGQLGRGRESYAENTPGKVRGIPDRVQTLAVGGSHTCAIQIQGGVACWGYNKYGQLGNLNFHDKGGLISFYFNDPVTAISAGAYHTCAIVDRGKLRCWGSNRYGQLGGEKTEINPFVEVAGDFQSVAAGGSHTCALSLSGRILCWGNDKFGQLGENVPTPTQTPMPTRTRERTKSATEAPTPTSELSNFVISIAAGRSHTCAVTASGAVKCWGRNEHGALGDGTTGDSSVPVDVVGLKEPAQTVVAGWGHTCALMRSGGVKCWGYNKNGELGNGGNADSLVPVDVSELEGGVVSLEAADDHTCAVLAGGNLACWGYNEYGQLGDGTNVNRNVPVFVNLSTFGARAAALGWGHTCVLLHTGGVKCWGNNELGQLGDGKEVANRSTPDFVSGLNYEVVAVSADGGHTCALKTNGTVVCWGNNKYGQLGDGTSEIRRIPAAVAGINLKVLNLAAGWNTTCAVGTGGELACWGWNYYGQLGNGIRTTSARPVEAREVLDGVLDAAAGWGHTCVITEFGAVQCFGLNEYGQLGDGTNENGYLPVPVIGLDG